MISEELTPDENPEEKPQDETPWFEGLSVQHQQFVEQYCKHFNGARAAREAGYAEESARQTAHRLITSDYISEAVKKYLAEKSMSAEEAVKHLTDIARTRPNEFLKVKQAQGHYQSERYVTALLESVKEEIEHMKAFMEKTELDKKESRALQRRINEARELQMTYELDIMKYGNEVTRLAAGAPCVVEVVEFDIVALAKAEEEGRIKSIAWTEFGPKVEFESVIAATDRILKLQGKFIDKHEVGGKDGQPIEQKVIHEVTPESARTFLEIFRQRYK
jgi:phage terminase small subunit